MKKIIILLTLALSTYSAKPCECQFDSTKLIINYFDSFKGAVFTGEIIKLFNENEFGYASHVLIKIDTIWIENGLTQRISDTLTLEVNEIHNSCQRSFKVNKRYLFYTEDEYHADISPCSRTEKIEKRKDDLIFLRMNFMPITKKQIKKSKSTFDRSISNILLTIFILLIIVIYGTIFLRKK